MSNKKAGAMKNVLVLGTFALGVGSLQGSFTAPANLSPEMLEIVSFDTPMETIAVTQLEDEDNEVTHEVFFGENIKRVIKTLTHPEA